MTWLSAALLALAPCALSQVQLAASGPGVGQVSEPLTLTCAVSGGSVTADYWDWYRQLPRGALDGLGEIDWYNSRWRVRYAPSVQGRVTLSADSSKNQVSLLLRSLTAADTATYYCARRDTVTQRQGPVSEHWGGRSPAELGGSVGSLDSPPPSISGALSQVRLVESGPGVGKVSEPLALTCAVSGESIASSDYLWYRIPASAEAGLEYLGVITRSGTPFPAQSLRNHLTISRDTAKSQVSLQLLSLRAADSAAYHCARREAQRHGHGGAGTKRGVNVTGTFGAVGGRGRDQLREAHPSGAEKGPKLKAGGLDPQPSPALRLFQRAPNPGKVTAHEEAD
ncbi:Ig heavy chain Mem5-like [Mauremys mutica]|uniref:Ig heavy chain Mem5-like n=1 Tax=Mauremys mutica TaxID=74926 RepID=UPI001D1612B8|nr:Ig heavy chain Mem5-like [Mauremys mutica]